MSPAHRRPALHYELVSIRARDWLLARRWTRVLYRTVEGALEPEVRDQAAAPAFWAFGSTFPLRWGGIGPPGYFLDQETVRDQVTEALSQSLPGSEKMVSDNIDAIIDLRGAFGLVGVIALFWAARSGFSALSRAINRMWQVAQAPPPSREL